MTPETAAISAIAGYSRAPIISTDNLTVHYDDRPALADVSIAVHRGETLSILGPNGAGKSTLLKVIAGMLAPSHGSVTMEGVPLKGTNPRITYVPQRSGADWTFPISVIDAVLLGISRSTPRWRGFSSADRERALKALAEVRMEHLAKVQIGSLSGGQQQRVFLARALLQCGDVLLLDEPFAGVDVPTQELFVHLFRTLSSRGTAIVYATHDLPQAFQNSDRVMMVNRRLVAIGTPDDVMNERFLRETFGGNVVVLPSPVQVLNTKNAPTPEAVLR
jgi:ABC-type Mn2+/Zn2+ transport system ATPase subunit